MSRNTACPWCGHPAWTHPREASEPGCSGVESEPDVCGCGRTPREIAARIKVLDEQTEPLRTVLGGSHCVICGEGEEHDLAKHIAAGTLNTRARGVIITDSPAEPFPATYETRP